MSDKFSIDHLREWIGRTETRRDHIGATQVGQMYATLDRDEPEQLTNSELPLAWHWMFFAAVARHTDVGPDGHPKRGGFLPPVPLPRRMWAGGRLSYHHALRVGDDIERTSRVTDVVAKQGRTGQMVFVKVEHEISDADGVAIKEEHDIVYRENPKQDEPQPQPRQAPEDETFSREIDPDPVMLFRYSALTFNGHRIHYDRSYVTEVEGYPGLIVHGPLTATFLVELLRDSLPDAQVRSFSFRAVRPLFDIHRFQVCGRQGDDGRVRLWTRDHEGWLTMEASATLA
ncbi:MAG: MaoC family dehydratase N-terminal domain-containing protein [Betaproteobacteria bacterium]|nr:MAG: MaoC family dehydratase N-terminal domain-containing protein [Betaproteobacteria bacterium]